jgi:predicted outer membrane repeat protein
MGIGVLRRGALLAAVASFAALPGVAYADNTFNVTTTADTPLGATVVCPADGSAPPAGDACTLRAAVLAADDAGGTSTINLQAATYTLTIPPDGSGGTGGGSLVIQSDGGETVNIAGQGSGQTVIDGGALDRVLTMSDATATLSGLTIRNGAAGTPSACDGPAGFNDADGGGIYNFDGNLTLNGVVVSGNTAYGNGGGIATEGNAELHLVQSSVTANTACLGGSGGGVFVAGTDAFPTPVTVDSSTISANTAAGGGGGVEVQLVGDSTQPVTITASTLSANTAQGGNGGGLDDSSFPYSPPAAPSDLVRPETASNSGYGPVVVNSTITGNTAAQDGGGLAAAFETASLLGDTVASNTAQGQNSDLCGSSAMTACGDNLAALALPGQPGGSFSIRNTIVAYAKTSNCDPQGSYVSGGYNLFDEASDSCEQGDAAAAHDHVGADPLLGSLAANGGATQTRALLSGSPAIDQIPATSCGWSQPHPGVSAPGLGPLNNGFEMLTVDQHGVTRPQNTLCDIGAFEADTDMQVTSTASSANSGVGRQDTVTDTVTNNGATDGSNVTLTDPGAGFTIASATSSQGSCTIPTPTTVSCQLGTIKAGASATVTIVIVPTSAGTITLTAQVSASETDPNAANNTATTVIQVAAPQIGVSASAPCASVRDFTIHILNARRLHIFKARVLLSGRLDRTLTGSTMSTSVDLRSLPYGTFTVKITAWTRSGRVLHSQRVYHTCRLKPLGGHKHLLLATRSTTERT